MNRNFFFMALSLFTWGIGEGMFFNFQPIYLEQLGSNPQQIGMILGGFGFAMAITHIPAGYLADKLGRRPMLLAAWTIGLFATVMMAFARRWPATATPRRNAPPIIPGSRNLLHSEARHQRQSPVG